MSQLISDPMVHFPTEPQLLPNINIIIEEAVTVIGSVDGPFRLNGTRAKEIVSDLLPLLKQGISLEALYIKARFSKEEVDQLLEILFIKGCLMQKEDHQLLDRTDKFYLRYISKFKNFSSLKAFKTHLDNCCIYILGKDALLVEALKENFESFNITTLTANDFNPVSLSNKRSLCIYTDDFNETSIKNILGYMDVLYVNYKGQQFGPLFSQKGIMPDEYIGILESLKINPSVEEMDEKEFLNCVTLNTVREIGKINNTSLVEGFYKKEFINFKYYALRNKLYEHEVPSIVSFEKFIQFPASKFVNASSHLTHYKSKNLKLTVYNQASFLWKKLDDVEVPSQIDLLMRKTVGYKDLEIKYKRYTPTGGNINSNLLFYVNINDKAFMGKGIYFYNNTDNTYYQIMNDELLDVTNFVKLLDRNCTTNQNVQGYLLLGNDTDIIAEKYNDFSFKIANLNNGILLSNLMSLSKIADVQLKVHTRFDEKAILHLLGIERSNEIINFVVEVV